MPPKVVSKTKEQKAAAATASSKAKKKKWSKGKTRDPLDNAVMWEPSMVDRLIGEVPKMKVITVSVISDRLKVSGSLAREALKYLEAKDLIRGCSKAKSCKVYTRVAPKKATEEEVKASDKS
ncbi:ribosomal protein S25 [Perkinsela sp. CCAP 1560/4]|nr:ribosomal protein S25 [Perkinsela sp. CCAP 1560/4]KNH06712.1 ribosomal protein S25 [Perkinsela sp. CCAP 1560/4]|eukprot:KNH04707.1 ribosomal protein S25 [Perkinsela sp. CCAP 1560/4]